MTITRFFVDALGSALDLGLATADDVLKHATPDVLARHLPRPLWSQLIAACLRAPRTDARLVVDTVTVANLCEHVPKPILWACLAEIGTRALGRSILAMPPAPRIEPPPPVAPLALGTSPGISAPIAVPVTPVVAPAPVVHVPAPVAPPPVAHPPVAAPAHVHTAVPGPAHAPVAPAIALHVPTRAQTEPPAPLGDPPPVGARAQAARPTASPTKPTPPVAPAPTNGAKTAAAPVASQPRRPQATATAAPQPAAKQPRTTPPSQRRGTTNSDFDLDTDVSGEWKAQKVEAVLVDVDDEQLVDWAQSDETITGGLDPDRKR
jgi:hypothetical protein